MERIGLPVKMNKRITLFLLIVIAVIAFYGGGGKEYLSFSFIQIKLSQIQGSFESDPLKFSFGFFVVYVLITALSFPGAAVLTLLAGAIFGPWVGVLIVSFASTFGSICAFLVSRFLLRDLIKTRFRRQFSTIDKNIEKDGAIYLATLRLVPIFPFFVVNLVMGLTAIKPWTFVWISQLGMLPGTAVYIYAGRELSQLTSLQGIMSPEVISVFFLLGTLPLLGKFIVRQVKRNQLYHGHHKPNHFDYNLVTIGAGSAGLVTSYIAAAVKSKVALIEKHKMGGDCLNTGCVPSKALIKSSKIIHLQKRSQSLGIKKIDVEFNFGEIMERIQRVIKEIEPHDSTRRYEELGVECILGEAKIISPWVVQVGHKTLITKNIVIATGAKPAIPKIKGIELAKFVTSDTLWQIRELPKRFVIMGGGPIGCEMAQAFSRLGSEVILIEASDRLLAKEDPEVSQLIASVFKEEGVKVLTSHQVMAFNDQGDKKTIICEYNQKEIVIPYDLVLIAVGRKPNTEGFGLRELGIKFTDRGTVDVNEYQQSNYPNIFACGDVAGPYQLTHMAAHQAWYCAVNGLSPLKFKIDYSAVPWCTYTDPEVATVGETATSAREKGLQYDVTEYQISELDRAITESEKQGFVRIITVKGKDKILGATIVSSQASSMILEFVSAMKFKKGLNSILSTIHVYPSFGEANKYAAGTWKKSQTSEKTLAYLEKYFNWVRK
jgi:dihydrolipoamide dehydrogenase